MKSFKTLLAFVAALATAPNYAFSQAVAAPAAAAVPAAAPATLWSFLGIPQGVKKVQGALTNRRGNLPRLEPKDAIKALNDPRNLESKNPAIKKAAELKVQEDLKPQKIKALKYLTSIGCGCYDKGGEVTDALIAAAEDCTEDVRLTVMQEIKAAASNKCCNNCGQVCCCSDKMLKKLAEVAYERDDEGCYKEPSARVRQAAAEALRTCVPNSEPPCIAPEELEKLKEKAKADQTEPPKTPLKEAPAEPEIKPLRESKSIELNEGVNSDKQPKVTEDKKPLELLKEKAEAKLSDSASTQIDSQRSSRRRFQSEYTNIGSQLPTQASGSVPEQASGFELEHAFHPELNSLIGKLADNEGVVISYDDANHTAHIHFSNRQVDLREGDEIAFASDSSSSNLISGKWRVVYAESGCVRMVPLDEQSARGTMSGQHLVLSMGPVSKPVAPVSTRKRSMSK